MVKVGWPLACFTSTICSRLDSASARIHLFNIVYGADSLILPFAWPVAFPSPLSIVSGPSLKPLDFGHGCQIRSDVFTMWQPKLMRD